MNNEISRRLEEVITPYIGKKEYGYLRQAFWEKELGTAKVWQLYYDDASLSTYMIQFEMRYLLFVPVYCVSGKMIKAGVREKEEIFLFLEGAVSLFCKRISEIPRDLQNFLNP